MQESIVKIRLTESVGKKLRSIRMCFSSGISPLKLQ